MMEELNRMRMLAGVEMSQLADSIGIGYIALGKMFAGKELCPSELKEKIKIFLIKNYTECIERL